MIPFFSIVLHVGSEWKEFFYDSLIPWYHYVPVPDAIRGPGEGSQAKAIEDLLRFLKNDDKIIRDYSGQIIGQQIAANGRQFIEQNLNDWLSVLQGNVII